MVARTFMGSCPKDCARLRPGISLTSVRHLFPLAARSGTCGVCVIFDVAALRLPLRCWRDSARASTKVLSYSPATAAAAAFTSAAHSPRPSALQCVGFAWPFCRLFESLPFVCVSMALACGNCCSTECTECCCLTLKLTTQHTHTHTHTLVQQQPVAVLCLSHHNANI